MKSCEDLDVAERFDELVEFLSTGRYPDSMIGCPGSKSNLRRQARNFTLKEGALYYKHKLRGKKDAGKFYVTYLINK